MKKGDNQSLFGNSEIPSKILKGSIFLKKELTLDIKI
jgi:hypothetical protein